MIVQYFSAFEIAAIVILAYFAGVFMGFLIGKTAKK